MLKYPTYFARCGRRLKIKENEVLWIIVLMVIVTFIVLRQFFCPPLHIVIGISIIAIIWIFLQVAFGEPASKRKIKNKLFVVLMLFLTLLRTGFFFIDNTHPKHGNIKVYNKEIELTLKKISTHRFIGKENGLKNFYLITDSPKEKFHWKNKFINLGNVFSINNSKAGETIKVYGIFGESIDPSNWIFKSRIRSIRKESDSVEKLMAYSHEVEQYVQSESGGVGWAMFTGNIKGISKETYSKFRSTGTNHVFAVSGLHIGVFYLIFLKLLSVLNLPKFVRVTLGLFVCGMYVSFIASSESAIRALQMIAFYESSKFLFRKSNIVCALCISASSMLFFDPSLLFSMSFQLSFTVVAFIICFFKNTNFINSKKPCYKYLISSLGCVFAASCGSSIIVIDYFNYFSFFSIFTNFFVYPFFLIFYIVNFLHLLFLFFLDNNILKSFLDFFYFMIEYFIDHSNFISRSINVDALIFKIPDYIHIIIFFSVLLITVFVRSFVYRFFLLLLYYSCIWVFCLWFCLQ